MANCKECLHFEVCAHRHKILCAGTKVEDLNHECTKFKDRTKWAEQKTGHWKWRGGIPWCSHCGEMLENYSYDEPVSTTCFCSKCGAFMFDANTKCRGEKY